MLTAEERRLLESLDGCQGQFAQLPPMPTDASDVLNFRFHIDALMNLVASRPGFREIHGGAATEPPLADVITDMTRGKSPC